MKYYDERDKESEDPNIHKYQPVPEVEFVAIDGAEDQATRCGGGGQNPFPPVRLYLSKK